MILLSLLLTKSLHMFVVYDAITETEMSSFWWNFVTGCTGSCQNDNFQCSQWQKFHQNDNISVSVIKYLHLNDTFLFVADQISAYVCCIWGYQVLAFLQQLLPYSQTKRLTSGSHMSSPLKRPPAIPKGSCRTLRTLLHNRIFFLLNTHKKPTPLFTSKKIILILNAKEKHCIVCLWEDIFLLNTHKNTP